MIGKILVVDDEKTIVKGLKFSLEKEGYVIDCAYDGEEAIECIKANQYSLIILDVMLPKKDGLEVCKIVRSFTRVPIIMLTAKGDDLDKILGLEFGADDYLTKPFNMLELKARIKAIFRRNEFVREKNKHQEEVLIEKGDLRIDRNSRQVFVKQKEVNLTAKEYDLLELLIHNPGKVYSREKLLSLVWGYDFLGDGRAVDVHIRRLREKIEVNPSEPRIILTKWGVGYYYQA